MYLYERNLGLFWSKIFTVRGQKLGAQLTKLKFDEKSVKEQSVFDTVNLHYGGFHACPGLYVKPLHTYFIAQTGSA